jgi:NADH dehydrogenase FAD-containing subunit
MRPLPCTWAGLARHVQVSLVEASAGLLGAFDRALADYYQKGLKKMQIDVRLGTAVIGIEDATDAHGHHFTLAHLSDGSKVPFGLMVWSAGLAPVKFVQNSGLQLHARGGRIIVDDYLRVPGSNGRVFALGDCAGHQTAQLPPTASVAEQQAQYLGDCFNQYYSKFDVVAKPKTEELPLPGPVIPALMPVTALEFLDRLLCKAQPQFQYKNRGSMAGMGWGGGVADLTKSELPVPGVGISGFAAFVMWRTTYLSKQLSYANMLLVPMMWLKTFMFGRDISRF